MKVIMGILLILAAMMDGKRKEVPLWLMGGLVVVALVDMVVYTRYRELSSWFGILPGVLLVLTSVVSSGQVGMADGIVLAGIGLGVGWFSVISILFIALVLAASWSVLLLLCRRAGRKTTIAFVPFLCAAYGGVMFFG